ncbi:MAG: type 11 methyltransferase [Bacteroidetes bacterium]|nr:type 11 methyltransferase [Bacteroidota bacterium]
MLKKEIKGKDFFDKFPQFYSSSPNGDLKSRLHDRFDAIFLNGNTDFSKKTVLDLAAHDGRWSWAARFMGANHVTAVEINPIHLEAYSNNMAAIEFDTKWYSLIQDDVVHFLESSNAKFDLVLCLGWFYHTTYQIDVIKHLALITNEMLVLDTECINDSESAYFKVRLNKDHSLSSYTESFTQIPSLACIRLLLGYYGFKYTEYNWANNISCHDECSDYAESRRATFFCTKKIQS